MEVRNTWKGMAPAGCVTINEAAAELRLSVAHLTKMIAKGKLEVVRVPHGARHRTYITLTSLRFEIARRKAARREQRRPLWFLR